MTRAISLTFLLLSLLCLSSQAQTTSKKTNYIKEGYVKAMVIKYDVDGCGFLIELNDKEKSKLMPDKIDEKFKKNKKKIWIKYVIAKKQLHGTCMAGKQIEVLDMCTR